MMQVLYNKFRDVKVNELMELLNFKYLVINYFFKNLKYIISD